MDLKKKIAQVEDPLASETSIKSGLSDLLLSGIPQPEQEDEAVAFWKIYFKENLVTILEKDITIESRILEQEVIEELFNIEYQAYMEYKKQMGIDDIRKYWLAG